MPDQLYPVRLGEPLLFIAPHINSQTDWDVTVKRHGQNSHTPCFNHARNRGRAIRDQTLRRQCQPCLVIRDQDSAQCQKLQRQRGFPGTGRPQNDKPTAIKAHRCRVNSLFICGQVSHVLDGQAYDKARAKRL